MAAKVSVIIPTYNRAHTLERALGSVLNQTFTDWQLIIVDDGSTDNTQELIQSISDPRIETIFTENRGVSYARNKGIERSTSPWLAFLDSDDEWLSHKLSVQVELAENNPELQIIHGDEIWIRHGVRVNPMNKHQKRGGDIFRDAIQLCCISPSTVMLKKTLIEQFGLFREDYPVCEDYDLWLKITAHYPVGYIKDPLIKKYGGHSDQLSLKLKAMDYWRILSLKSLLEKESLDPERKSWVKESIKERSEILLNGYRKHQNLENFDEIFRIKESL